LADQHAPLIPIMTRHAAELAIPRENAGAGRATNPMVGLSGHRRDRVMRMLPELFLLIALMAALVGFGATSGGLARAGQSVFIASVIFVMVSMMVENWRAGPPTRDTFV
jgi:uncharacterized membrane protein YtjA (UPF0391 family)